MKALLNAAAQLAVPAELLGLATGIVIGVRAVGIAIGTVILVSVFSKFFFPLFSLGSRNVN